MLLRSFMGTFFAYVITEYLIGKRLPPAMRQGALDYFVDIFLHGITKGNHHELPPDLDRP
jgi:hypothetical protein